MSKVPSVENVASSSADAADSVSKASEATKEAASSWLSRVYEKLKSVAEKVLTRSGVTSASKSKMSAIKLMFSKTAGQGDDAHNNQWSHSVTLYSEEVYQVDFKAVTVRAGTGKEREIGCMLRPDECKLNFERCFPTESNLDGVPGPTELRPGNKSLARPYAFRP